MVEFERVDDVLFSKVEEYVFKNYKDYKDKQLIIETNGKLFKIRIHKDGSPLFLGVGVVG